MTARLVDLTDAEHARAEEHGVAVYENGQRRVREGTMRDKQLARNMTGLEIQILGFAGEFAVHKLTGAPLRWVLDKDDGVDIVIGCWPCQIKTRATLRDRPDLLFRNLEDFEPKALAAIGVQRLAPRRFKVWGCITRRKFMRDYQMVEIPGYGKSPGVPCAKLADITVLGPLAEEDRHADWWRDYDLDDPVEKAKKGREQSRPKWAVLALWIQSSPSRSRR